MERLINQAGRVAPNTPAPLWPVAVARMVIGVLGDLIDSLVIPNATPRQNHPWRCTHDQRD